MKDLPDQKRFGFYPLYFQQVEKGAIEFRNIINDLIEAANLETVLKGHPYRLERESSTLLLEQGKRHLAFFIDIIDSEEGDHAFWLRLVSQSNEKLELDLRFHSLMQCDP